MNRIILLSLFLAAACGTHTPPKAPEPDPIAELSATVNEFLDDFYIERNEEKFWSYVGKNSMLRKYDWAAEIAFKGAFYGPPAEVDPANLKLGAEPLMQYFEEHPGMIMNPGNTRFIVVRPGLGLVMSNSYEPEPGDESYEWYTSLKSLEDAGLLYTVLYHVDGAGYNTEIMATFWTQEDGVWKLYSFSGFD